MLPNTYPIHRRVCLSPLPGYGGLCSGTGERGVLGSASPGMGLSLCLVWCGSDELRCLEGHGRPQCEYQLVHTRTALNWACLIAK